MRWKQAGLGAETPGLCLFLGDAGRLARWERGVRDWTFKHLGVAEAETGKIGGKHWSAVGVGLFDR